MFLSCREDKWFVEVTHSFKLIGLGWDFLKVPTMYGTYFPGNALGASCGPLYFWLVLLRFLPSACLRDVILHPLMQSSQSQAPGDGGFSRWEGRKPSSQFPFSVAWGILERASIIRTHNSLCRIAIFSCTQDLTEQRVSAFLASSGHHVLTLSVKC